MPHTRTTIVVSLGKVGIRDFGCLVLGLRYLVEWALPDQLVYSTVYALLRISSVHEDKGRVVVDAIVEFITEVIENLKSSNCDWLSIQCHSELTHNHSS